LSITGISKIQSAPTAISETTMGVTFTAEAFLDKATSYSLKAMYGTTVLWQTTSNFLYSSEQSSKTYKVYLSLNPTIFKAGSTYEIEFIASDNAKPDIVGISKNYVSIKESEDSYLSYDSVALNKQIVGIYAGTVPHGSNID